MVNSSNKGKVIERAAAKFLSQMGFPTIRGEQHKGGPDSPDLRPPPGLEDGSIHNAVHIEVKGDKSIRLGTVALLDACTQAIDERGDKFPVVLWFEHRRGWRLTLARERSTYAGDADIESWLRGAAAELKGMNDDDGVRASDEQGVENPEADPASAADPTDTGPDPETGQAAADVEW